MPPENFWSRLRKGRLVQVVLIYLGASWLVLQIGDTLEDALDLPDWVLPSAFLMLLVGLVVVLATAWIQSHPLVAERAAAEEVPHAWELDARDLRGSLRERRLPHLTWPRALLGGAAAFMLLVVAVAVVVALRGDGRLGGASPAAAETLPGLAILPFAVSGEGAEVWREGMVDVLSTNLDGAAGLRTIDSRNVLARWRETVGDREPDAALALDAARATGARYALLGSAVSLGDRVRLSAELHDLETGQQLGALARTEGPRDSLFAVIDNFSVEILRNALREKGVTAVRGLRGVERLTTSSLPALLAFLEGEAAFRRAEFGEAIDAYERALAADSTFALVSFRLAHAYGWSQNISAEASTRASDLGMRYVDRVPPRDAALARLSYFTLRVGIADSIPALRALADRYPDDPEIWYQLGEAIAHSGQPLLIPQEDAERAFHRTIALDSSFAPAYLHAVEFATRRGDIDGARRLLAGYERYGDEERYRRMGHLVRLMDGTAPASFLDSLRTAQLMELQITSIMTTPDRASEIARISEAAAARQDVPEGRRQLSLITAGISNAIAGRPARGLALTQQMRPHLEFILRWVLVNELGVGDSAALDAAAAAVDREDATLDVLMALGAHAAGGGDRGGLDQVVRALRTRASERRAVADSASDPRLATEAQIFDAGADALLAHVRWKAGGDAQSALDVFVRARHSMHGVSINMDQAAALVRQWEADAQRTLGRHREAALLYESLPWSTRALYDAAGAWEAADNRARAHATWARLASMWRNADPDFPLRREMLAGLERTAADR